MNEKKTEVMAVNTRGSLISRSGLGGSNFA